MAGSALIAGAVYVVVALVGPSMRRRRITGDWGFRNGAGLPGGPAVLALVGALAVGPVLDLAGVLPRLWRGPAAAGVGLALASLGVGGVVWAQRAMGASWRVGVDPGEDTELVVAGPFRVVRNPIYTSMVIFAGGITALAANAASIASLVATAAILDWHVRRIEEPNLARHHPRAYAKYGRMVGRFVPGIGYLDSQPGGDQAGSRPKIPSSLS